MESEKAHLAAQIQVWKHEIQDNTRSETLLAFIRLALRGKLCSQVAVVQDVAASQTANLICSLSCCDWRNHILKFWSFLLLCEASSLFMLQYSQYCHSNATPMTSWFNCFISTSCYMFFFQAELSWFSTEKKKKDLVHAPWICFVSATRSCFHNHLMG